MDIRCELTIRIMRELKSDLASKNQHCLRFWCKNQCLPVVFLEWCRFKCSTWQRHCSSTADNLTFLSTKPPILFSPQIMPCLCRKGGARLKIGADRPASLPTIFL